MTFLSLAKRKGREVWGCITCVAWHAFSAIMMVKNSLALENSLRDAVLYFCLNYSFYMNGMAVS